MVAEASRLEVEPTKRFGDPVHALLENLDTFPGVWATPSRGDGIPGHDDVKAPIQDSPFAGEFVEKPPVRVPQWRPPRVVHWRKRCDRRWINFSRADHDLQRVGE